MLVTKSSIAKIVLGIAVAGAATKLVRNRSQNMSRVSNDARKNLWARVSNKCRKGDSLDEEDNSPIEDSAVQDSTVEDK